MNWKTTPLASFKRLIVRHKSAAGHRVFGGTTKGKRIPRLAGGVAARHRKIDPFLCQRRRGGG